MQKITSKYQTAVIAPRPLSVPEHTEEEKSPLAKVAEAREKRRRYDISDQLAKDKFFYRNYHHTGLKDKFPHQSWMWSVDRYYPMAEGGALYVDEPNFTHQEQQCIEKAAFFKAQGLRYVIIKSDTVFEDALAQLAA